MPSYPVPSRKRKISLTTDALYSLKTWKNVPALDLAVGTTSSLVPNGYSSLNWANLYGVSPSIVAQFLLPQGKKYDLSLLVQSKPIQSTYIPC